MSLEVRWIHVFLHKKDNASNSEAQLLKLREVSDWCWYYELHEGGSVLQMKARIPGAIDDSLAGAVNLLRRLGASGDWTLSHHVIVLISVGALAWGQVLISYVYEPLRDNSVFTDIAQSTIFRAIPAKLVRPAERVENELYQPIIGDKEIRLLILEPGARGDPLECELVNAELSWRTRFEALSYAWGDDITKHELKCSGHMIGVMANLHDALLDLRLPTQRRVLWIDALCINQADNDEKSKQIRLMHEIYSQAYEVLIYLGKSDASVHGAIESMRWLDWKLMPLYARQFLLSSNIGMTSFFVERWMNMKPIDREDFSWDPIINLLRRPWFQRTWVIQEAVIPKHAKTICGDQSIAWVKVLRIVDAIRHYQSSVKRVPGYHLTYETISSVDLMRSARDNRHPRIYILGQWWYRPLITGRQLEGQEDSKLLDLILMSRRYKCTHPHDKIFGMLGVTAEDTSSKLLEPDYEISQFDAYRNFVLWEIRHNKSLRVLGTSSRKSSRQCTSPSWVPDFNRLDSITGLTGSSFTGSYVDASAGLPMEVRESNDSTSLHIKGSIVDTIHTVGKKSFTDRSTRLSKRQRRDEELSVYDQLQVNRGMIEEASDIWLEATKGLARGLGPGPGDRIFKTEVIDGRPVPDRSISPGWEPFLRVLLGDVSVGSKYSMFIKEISTSFLRLTLAEDQLPKQYIKGEEAFAIKALGFFAAIARSRRFARTDMGAVRGQGEGTWQSSNAAIGSSAEQAFVSLHQETIARSVQNISSH
ncbi:heterokaryon incompatibility 6 OR allele [Fusarium pseudocircinatum]|uniref:Heterokaryon incompatibility 6 OR allele n=1 Tax=Fusarium pseudocircinatum TaxID=56676 RepID=A0A8H5L2G5_9HYPO|nr:heterokaryon incompatibility 6 OR allele [Fusarium pseudocircinatum]